jgi:anthranilate/para-aminobenzoate synthase component I
VIVAAGPLDAAGAPLDAAAAARAAGQGRLPVWSVSPGDGDLGAALEVVACDPVRVVRDDLAALEAAWHEERARWSAGPGVPIAAGYLSYELGRQFETIRGPIQPSPWPLLEFRFYDALWVRSAGRAEIWARDEAAARRLFARLSVKSDAQPTDTLGPLCDLDPPADYLAGVRRILDYLRAGDVYQVNLARRMTAVMPAGAGPAGLALFTRLQAESPAPHAFWFPGDDGSCLVGNSPERFLRVSRDGAIETRPIKGTRPRDGGAAAAELARHPKDLAEHIMIVDLERNDLGRVCRAGSVAVEGFARTLSLPTVHHLVTTVRGQLRPEVGLPQLLRATFPGGSITGAPKIRAMEIIAALEPAARGPYTGATGWLGAAGDLDLAIAIRTALVRDQRLTLWVGGGIVADSSPDEELAETVAKASAFARLAK